MNQLKKFIFFIPILGLLKIELVGQLYVNEVFLGVFLTYKFLTGDVFLNKIEKQILAMILLWLLGQVASDLLNNTDSSDYLRGWAKITTFAVAFLALSNIIKSSEDVIYYFFGIAVLKFFTPVITFFQQIDYLVLWKFGVGNSLLLFFSVLLIKKIHKLNGGYVIKILPSVAFLHILFGVGSFFLNSRSFAAISIVVGVILYLYYFYGEKSIGFAAIFSSLAAIILIANIMAGVYAYGASSGLFGEDSKIKYEMQTSYEIGLISLLFGGRSEGLVSTIAIADSPIIGHGSWAKDIKYSLLHHDIRRQFSDDNSEVDPTQIYGFSELIPTHSYILGSWVEAGVLGGVFWLYIIYLLIFVAFPFYWRDRGFFGVVYIITAPFFLWDIMFSPFGANVKFEIAGLLAIYCCGFKYLKHSEK
jgi:hypothetical protein